MSAGTITVENGWAMVEQIVKNINDVSTSERLRLADMVDEQIRDEIAAAAPERVVSTSSIGVTSGTSSYALPADFEDVQGYGMGFYKLNPNGTVDTRLAVTGFGSQSEGYYLEGDNVVFTPTPATSYTVTLKYLPERTEFTATSDIFSVPNKKKYRELVRQGLLVQYYLFKRRLDLKQLAELDYQATLDDLISNIRTTPNVGLLPDFSRNY